MTVGAIDIGSNSVRLLILDSGGHELARDVTVTGLGRGIESHGSFHPDAVAMTLQVIKQYADTIVRYDAETVKAVATSASRDATNGTALMDEIGRLLGVRPVIIDGQAEANLAFSGATRDLPQADSKLVIDIGGGSTEVVLGRTGPDYARSIDVGSVRVTDRFVMGRPVPADVVDVMRDSCDTLFASIDIPSGVDHQIGVAGTLTNLSAMAMHLEVYDRTVVDGSYLSLAVVTELIGELAKLTIAQTEAIPSLDPRRASVILGGSIIAERILMRCGVAGVRISERDLLDGLAAELLGTLA